LDPPEIAALSLPGNYKEEIIKCAECGALVTKPRWNTKYCKDPACIMKRRKKAADRFLEKERKRMGWKKRHPRPKPEKKEKKLRYPRVYYQVAAHTKTPDLTFKARIKDLLKVCLEEDLKRLQEGGPFLMDGHNN